MAELSLNIMCGIICLFFAVFFVGGMVLVINHVIKTIRGDYD
jgi:hypothetical protein